MPCVWWKGGFAICESESVLAVTAETGTSVNTDSTRCSCDQGSAPSKLVVAGCDKQPCAFQPGKPISADVSFSVDHTVTKMKPDVKALALGTTIDYPLPQQDGCAALVDASCPVESGESIIYHLQLNIPPIHIKSGVNLTFTMADQSSKTLTCFKLSGQVV
ncbi:NPC intracellular cholesterol transporter 2 isoform X2 [Bacillus rossius redtenbacheri]|uniref:NPC intracellular cholesterol transporter 2 isoform X2 n=1 Tax=Bacillus rossius redtenbacheri TaxID=93214 RepID=UPI002FDEFE99